jgi:hypothetical protein
MTLTSYDFTDGWAVLTPAVHQPSWLDTVAALHIVYYSTKVCIGRDGDFYIFHFSLHPVQCTFVYKYLKRLKYYFHALELISPSRIHHAQGMYSALYSTIHTTSIHRSTN